MIYLIIYSNKVERNTSLWFDKIRIIVLESLLVVDADIASEWKLKPGKKVCGSCKKEIKKNVNDEPINADEHYNNYNMSKKDTERDCDILKEASKELLQDQVKQVQPQWMTSNI